MVNRDRIITGANAWRKIEGVIGDRRISRELRQCAHLVCYPDICVWPRNDNTIATKQRKRCMFCKNW